MIVTAAIPGFNMRRALSCSERFTVVLLIVLNKVTLSSVTMNSSPLSVELLDTMGMVRLLTRLPAVKVTSEDAIAAKSAPSIARINKLLSFEKFVYLLLFHCWLI